MPIDIGRFSECSLTQPPNLAALVDPTLCTYLILILSLNVCCLPFFSSLPLPCCNCPSTLHAYSSRNQSPKPNLSLQTYSVFRHVCTQIQSGA